MNVPQTVECDEGVLNVTIDEISKKNPKFIFTVFGQVDANGHEHGFSKTVPQVKMLSPTNY